MQNPERESILPAFHPAEHLIQIRNGQKMQDYLPVAWRLVWFRTIFPHGSIETEIIHCDPNADTEEEASVWNPEKRRSEKVIKHGKGLYIVRAVVKDGLGGVGTGTKSEKGASFPDALEKAETGAIGRALATLGFGTQFAPELDEEHRIVDSPIDRQSSAPSQQSEESTTITEQQLNNLKNIAVKLKRNLPDNVEKMSSQNAKNLLASWSADLNKQVSKRAV